MTNDKKKEEKQCKLSGVDASITACQQSIQADLDHFPQVHVQTLTILLQLSPASRQ